jgi:nucleoside-diphosphate-sugar epimerase
VRSSREVGQTDLIDERTTNVRWSDRTVLVLGGAGYIGSVLVTELLHAGAEVRVLDQLLYSNGFALAHLLDHPRLQFQRGDVRSSDDLAQAAQGARDVVLLAALVGDPICKTYPKLAREINEDGAKFVIDRLDDLGIARFVFTSTCSNYGIHESSRLATEESELNPQSLYAHTKIATEDYLLGRASELRSVVTVLRIATAYGLSPRMRFDLTVSHFAWELGTGRPLMVYDADTWRPYCHVRDICTAIMTVLTAPEQDVRGEVFNVGDTAQQFTKRMIVDEVCKHLADASVSYCEGATDPRNYRVSFDKIAHRLGFGCDYTVQDYVARLTSAVQAGIFSDVGGNPAFGNYEVRNIEPTW